MQLFSRTLSQFKIGRISRLGKMGCAALMFFFLINSANADMEQVVRSTCMISENGTGFVYREDKDKYYIATAGHVLGKENHVVFFYEGRKSDKIPAKVLWYKYSGMDILPHTDGDMMTEPRRQIMERDLGFLSINKADIKNYPLPKILPFASVNRPVKVGEVILSNGCPCNGTEKPGWPNMFKGQVLESYDNMFVFEPTIYPGRSGSAITNKDGTEAIGILVRKCGKDKGIGINVPTVYKFAEWKK